MTQILARQIAGWLNVARTLRKVSGDTDLSKLSRAQWKRAADWLDEGGLTLICWNTLREAGQHAFAPPEIRRQLDQNLEDHRLRIAKMLSEFHTINSSFEAEAIPYAVLKGFALIPEYSSDAFLRTSYDYDYLVAPESVSCAERALTTVGFIRKHGAEDHPIVYFNKDSPPRRPRDRDDLYTAAFPRTVELHYRLWDANTLKIPLAMPTDMLARREARELRSPPCSGPPVRYFALSREDELIFQALHVLRHILRNWCRLCSLLDIAYFLEQSAADSAFWNRFFVRLDHNQRLAEILGVVFLLASKVFGATIPDRVAEEIVGSLRRPLTLWVKRYGRDAALSNFSSNKFSLFLHREFVEDDSAWRQIRRKHLFPIHRPNRIVQAESLGSGARVARSWKQMRYVSQRVRYHLVATLRYEMESGRWYRERSRD
jgi:hypothetical protein